MPSISHDPPCLLVTLERPYDFVSPFGGDDYALMLVSYDPLIGEAMRNDVADAIVASGCRYACCAGHDCSRWDTAIDLADLRRAPDSGSLREDEPLMTTWHEHEPLTETLFFFHTCTSIDSAVPSRFPIVLLGADAEQEEAVTRLAGGQFGP